MNLKILTATTFAISLFSCGMSEKEIDAYKECANSIKYLDIYEKDGTHFSKTDEAKHFEMTICSARAKLYVEGYRVKKVARQEDYKIYQLSTISNRKSYDMYKELIKSGIEP